MSESDFKESIEKLEKIANEISKSATSLDDAIKLYEEGMKEATKCKKLLEKAEQKIIEYPEL